LKNKRKTTTNTEPILHFDSFQILFQGKPLLVWHISYSNERESLNSNYFVPVDFASVDALFDGVLKRAAEVTAKDVSPIVVAKKEYHISRLIF